MSLMIRGFDIEQIMYGQENRIVSATPVSPGHLLLRYSDGCEYPLDLTPIIDVGNALAPLADPAVFSKVEVVHGGTAIEFPGELDFCADALRVDCEFQKAGIADPWTVIDAEYERQKTAA